MGKGRILSAEGDGLYTIEILEDRARADSNRTTALNRVAVLDAKITSLEGEFSSAQSDVDAAATVQDQAIIAYQAEVTDGDDEPLDDLKKAMRDAGEALIEAAGKRDAIAASIRALKTERLGLQKRIDLIEGLPSLRQQQAWCGDYSVDLSGDVATAEVPGQAKQVLVHPGHDGAAGYDVARDGALQPALAGTPASVFYNLAMLPGWQKWRPTYRIATITAIDKPANACAITIEPATSSEQGLNVNAETSYTNVPIDYMTCNATAFQENDRVLVRFDRTDQSPTVIGFESQPRPCARGILVINAFADTKGFRGVDGFPDGWGGYYDDSGVFYYYADHLNDLETGYSEQITNNQVVIAMLKYPGVTDNFAVYPLPDWTLYEEAPSTTPTMNEFIAIYESAVTQAGGIDFHTVVFVLDNSIRGGELDAPPDGLVAELRGRGVSRFASIEIPGPGRSSGIRKWILYTRYQLDDLAGTTPGVEF